MFQNIGTTEILVFALVLILLFGSSKLKELAKGMGEASKELKKAKDEVIHTKEEVTK